MRERDSSPPRREPPPVAEPPPSATFSFPSHFPSLDSVARRPLSSPPLGSAIIDYSTSEQSVQFGLSPEFTLAWRSRCHFGLVSGGLGATSLLEFEPSPNVRFSVRPPDATSLLVKFRQPFTVGRCPVFVEAETLPRGKTEIGFTTPVIHRKFPFGSVRARFGYGHDLTAAVALKLGRDYQCRITFDGWTAKCVHWLGRPDSFLVSDMQSSGFCHFFSNSGISGQCDIKSKTVELRGAATAKSCECGAAMTCSTEPLKVVKWEIGAWAQLPGVACAADPQLFVKVGERVTLMTRFRVGDIAVEAGVGVPKAEFSCKLAIHQ
jgi:hypothetical protein